MDNEQKYRPRDIQRRTFEFAKRVVQLTNRMPRTVAGVELVDSYCVVKHQSARMCVKQMRLRATRILFIK